ncbi:MAG: hypothetical protein KY393_02545 [Actinobacteria bacterium]|nr:hypothetical protein [Actinomycetota bacterium]
MPEGDTVLRTARSLHRALAGRLLTGSDLRVPEYATVDLTGQKVTEVVPRGKHLLARTDAGMTVHSHLKMEGSWSVYGPHRRWSRSDHRIRAILANVEYTAVGRLLGTVQVLPTAGEQDVVGHLGPDLLGSDWDPAEALRRLKAAPERSIVDALLDQRNLAGIGNLYKNEVLYLKGINPAAKVGDVADPAGVVELARRLLSANTGRWSQTTTGNTNKGARHWVFERSGRPCRRCGAKISSARLGEAGLERITYWCPNCQPPGDVG